MSWKPNTVIAVLVCPHLRLILAAFTAEIIPIVFVVSVNYITGIESRLQKVAKQSQTQIERVSLFDGVEAFASDENSELVTLAEKLSGHGAEAVAFATEAPFFAAAKIDTVVMGAGSIDQAHQPDEFLALDQIDPMIGYLKKMIQHYCL